MTIPPLSRKSDEEKFEATARHYAALTGKDMDEARRDLRLAKQAFADDWERETRSRSYRQQVRQAKFEDRLVKLGERIQRLARWRRR